MNGGIELRGPRALVKARSAPHLLRGKPALGPARSTTTTTTSSGFSGPSKQGIVQYYLLAGNTRLLHRLRWVIPTSMLKTLASKHHSTVSKIAAKHKFKIEAPHGLRTCFEETVGRGAHRKPLVARFGSIPLRRQKQRHRRPSGCRQVMWPHRS